ncbi:THUMP-like domain-containing protein [Humidisolicoccus flavus]|uniref:class I SAM-dependent methyltransferase n=1 Tax=Humidisolicoccus flavus TaxID=3111414 RepID=UPI003249B0C8
MNVDDLKLLLTREGLQLVDAASALLDAGTEPLAIVSKLRSTAPPELVTVAMTQANLRKKAAGKFGDFAASMLFTTAGLEQATRLRVAALHAGRFERAGLTRVADLGCGIGADSLAMSSLGLHVTAVDRDEVTAAIASFNIAPFPDSTVSLGNAEDFDATTVDAIWLDPARRDGAGKRSHDFNDWSPSLETVFAFARDRPIGVKLGPGVDRSVIPEDMEAQWVSVGGDVVELTLWSGSLAREGIRRSALVLGEHAHELTGADDSADVEVRELGQYLYEPDGAVIRARLIGELARQLEAGMVSESIAYLTGDSATATPFATRFVVEEVLPLDVRSIAKTLRARDIGRLEIKKRGSDHDPAEFRKKLGLKGSKQATLFLTRIAGRHRAILAHRDEDGA